PNIECVVMGKHGLVTWGDESKATYEHTIAIIQEAEDYLNEKKRGKRIFGDLTVPASSETQRYETMVEVLPVIRGAISKYRHAILQYDDSSEVLEYVGSSRTGEVSQLGAACPDHLVHVKRQPLFVNWQPSQGIDVLKTALREGVADYETRYAQYFEECKVPGDEMRDPAPRVILIPGLGMVTTGKDITNADVSRQLYHRAISVIGASEAIGGFNSLSAKEA